MSLFLLKSTFTFYKLRQESFAQKVANYGQKCKNFRPATVLRSVEEERPHLNPLMNSLVEDES